VSRSYFTADIDRKVKQLAIFITGLAFLAAIGSALLASIFFARPIRRIVAELGHVENFRLSDVKRVATNLAELDDLSSALQRMSASLAAFAKFVPSEIVRSLLSHGIEPKPGGERREITVMFADLPGFTRMTEQFGDGITPFLTEFLTLATKAVHEEGGIVDKFIGDCIMGIWNAHGDDPEHAMNAARAAVRIRELMRDVRRPDGEMPINAVRIGLATGQALVGNIGSTERLSYTAIGDAVNVASRLEGMGKEFHASILINEEAKQQVAGRFQVRDLGETMIRGRNGKLRAYELLGPDDSVPETAPHEPAISIR
jgi:class 3 adenylate cyclase